MASGWRIVPENRARDAFVGEGARLFGGRWNSPGVAIVYGSQHKSLAALELLVHFNPITPNRFKVFQFQIPDSLIESVSMRNLPVDWRQEPPPPAVQQFGNAWAKGLRSAVLAIPSIIVPEEMNYLLNPAHSDFKKITLGKPEAFFFDTRLLV
ncbi:MAG: RES domain-containing protein [Verrucomicrobiota bacterium]